MNFKIGNWIARRANWIALICVIFAYTLFIFFMGMVYHWEKYSRVQQYEIQTKIIEYRLGTRVLGRDTMNVIKEKYN